MSNIYMFIFVYIYYLDRPLLRADGLILLLLLLLYY